MSEVKKIATRQGYADGLIELGKMNKDVVVLDADLAAATQTAQFKKAYPDRFFNCGIAEQNMIGVAAGRAFEQVRNTLGYTHLPVKIGATHAGISVGEDGATHQCNEDIAIMRTIPGMTIINPADTVEAKAAVIAAAEIDGPVYLRFGRLAVPVIFDENYKFEVGKGVTLVDGDDVTIIATGLMVERALAAAEQLKEEGVSARVINMATIKPLDNDLVIKAAKETGAIVTAEEHSVIGGLGSAVSELLSEECPTPIKKVGVEDVFGMSGPATELLDIFGLNAENICKKAKEAISMK